MFVSKVLIYAIITACLLSGCKGNNQATTGLSSIDYLINIENPYNDAISVKATIKGTKPGSIKLLHRSNPKEYIISAISVKNGQIREIPCASPSDKIFEIPVEPDGTACVEYSVIPGQIGKHGHQGYICKDFIVFDGRIYLIPDKRDEIQNVSLKFLYPPGWQIVTSFKCDGEAYNPAYYRNNLAFTSLEKSFTAFGHFSLKEKNIDGVKVKVFSFEKWKSEYKERISGKAFKLFSYFRKLFRCPMISPYVVCFFPRGSDGERVFGGVWSNGQAYEMPDDSTRNWELFAHRLAHIYNEYDPYGLDFKKQEDKWLIEGWASFIEIVSTEETGIDNGSKAWKRLYEEYLNKTSMNAEKYDLPIAKQYTVKDPDITEFLHYVKAPLIALALDVQIRITTANKKNLNGFMSYIYRKNGMHKGATELQSDLNSYTGTDFRSFLAANTESRGFIFPLWGFYKTKRKTNKQEKEICRISGIQFFEDDFYRFVQSRSRKINRFERIEEEFLKTKITDNELEKHGFVIEPDFFRDFETNISPESINLVNEKKRDLLRDLLEKQFFEEKLNKAKLKDFKIPLLEKWRGTLNSLKDEKESDYIDEIVIGGKRDKMIINEEKDIFSKGEQIDIVVKWKKRTPHQTIFKWLNPEGRIVYEKTQNTKEDYYFSWEKLPEGKSNAAGIWVLRIMIDNKIEAEVPFLVVTI